MNEEKKEQHQRIKVADSTKTMNITPLVDYALAIYFMAKFNDSNIEEAKTITESEVYRQWARRVEKYGRA